MRLEQSRRAQADLDDIRDFSVERFGYKRAIAYLDAIQQAFERILTYPEIGTMHPILRANTRSLRCERHRIFYEVEGDVVRVLRILREAMDARRQI